MKKDKCRNCTRAPADLNDSFCRVCLAPKIELPFYVRKNDGKNKHEQKPKNRWNKESDVD